MFVLCVSYSKYKRQSQVNQDREVQLKNKKTIPARHGRLSFVGVECCKVEVSARGRSLV
jgi:hypothetical protein